MADRKTGAWMYLRLQVIYATLFSLWGAWSYMLSNWAGIHHVAVGSLYTAFALGALVAPLVGPIADRKYPAQKVFSCLIAICGLALLACAYFAATEGALADEAFAKGGPKTPLAVPSFIWQAAMFFAGSCTLCSIPLLNTIVFKHVDRTKSPAIFVSGTCGWLAVNWILFRMGTNGVEHFYIIAAGIAAFSAIYALTLPNTPPSGAKNNDPFGLKALTLFKRRDFAVFMISVTMVGIFGSNFYFCYCGMCFADKSILNQISELLFMATLTFTITKIGLKWTLFVGMIAWSVRYYFFATGNDSLAAAGILLHGLAYTCLYSCSFIFGDKIASKENATSVQALVTFLLLGLSQSASGPIADYMLYLFKNQEGAEKSAIVLVESAHAQDASINEAVVPVAEAPIVVETAAPAAEVPVAVEAVPAPEIPVADNDARVAKEKKPFAGYFSSWWSREVWTQYKWGYIWSIAGTWCLFFAIFFAFALTKEPKSPEEEK